MYKLEEYRCPLRNLSLFIVAVNHNQVQMVMQLSKMVTIRLVTIMVGQWQKEEERVEWALKSRTS